MHRSYIFPLSLSFLQFTISAAANTNSTLSNNVIKGVNTAGTVRSCTLTNLESLLNILANSGEIIGICIGSYILISLILKPLERKLMIKKAALASAVISSGLLLPGALNNLVTLASDLKLFY